MLGACTLELTATDIAHASVRHIVGEAFSAWWLDHPTQKCPSESAKLSPYMKVSKIDPWGEEYRVFCNPSARREIRLRVSSNGPDRRPDTADDVRSW